jgi:hypothetical protein
MGQSPNGTLVVETDPPQTFALLSSATPNLLPTLPIQAGMTDQAFMLGDLFTADGKYFLYNKASPSPSIFAAATAGGLPIEIDQGVSQSYKWAVEKSRVIYATADSIRQVDLENPLAPKTVVSGVASTTFFLTSNRSKIVYTTSGGVIVGLIPALQ